MRNIANDKSAIRKGIDQFGLAVKAGPPSLSRAKQLVFLCGANRAVNTPSFRRQAIKKFIEGLSGDYSVIYAELVFNELMKIGSTKNALDLEHEISAIADKIVIVLESESAFCELGAFAHEALRRKLIVINSSRFRGSESFINTGPIAAMGEVKSPVLWYPMSPMGHITLDGIGAIFHDLKVALKPKGTKGSTIGDRDISDFQHDKISLYFVHDLVLFTGPLSHKELIEVLIVTFGSKPYNLLSHLLSVLRAAGLIVSNKVGDTWVFQAVSTYPFLNYGINLTPLMAAFRNFHLKNTPERFSLA